MGTCYIPAGDSLPLMRWMSARKCHHPWFVFCESSSLWNNATTRCPVLRDTLSFCGARLVKPQVCLQRKTQTDVCGRKRNQQVFKDTWRVNKSSSLSSHAPQQCAFVCLLWDKVCFTQIHGWNGVCALLAHRLQEPHWVWQLVDLGEKATCFHFHPPELFFFNPGERWECLVRRERQFASRSVHHTLNPPM